jgi:Protein of unknown function (DUF2934)
MMSRKLNTTSKGKSTASSEAIISKALKKKSGSAKKVQCAINGADRQRMIATAAYYKAEQQGFSGGHEIQDWLEAESEIENLLQNSK